MKKLLQDIVDYLSSVRFTFVILIATIVVAAIGTFVGQNSPPEEYVLRFGHTAYRVLKLLAVTDIYHSTYFNALLMLLVANITLCTLDLLPKRIRALSSRGTGGTSRYPFCETLTSRHGKDETTKIAHAALRRPLCRTVIGKAGETTTITSIPHPILGLGPIIVHISILMILVGGLISFLFGFSGDMFIIQGDQSRQVIIKQVLMRTLDFSVRLDKFTFERYPDGTPKEYRSDVTFIDGNIEAPATLLVNHPAEHRGIRFYQTSFGMEMDYATIEILDKSGKSIFVGDARWSEKVSVPGRGLSFTIVESSLDFMDLGPAVHLAVGDGKEKYDLWTFVNYPDFDKRRGGDYVFALKDYHEVPYSGITVVREPGVPLVFVGFIIMCVGFLFPVARSMGSLRIDVTGREDRIEVKVSALPGRFAGGFEEKFEKRVQDIREKLC